MSILELKDFRSRDSGVPPGCEELVRDLESIQIEERPSFAPELAAELERAWAEMGVRHRLPLVRPLLAACLAAVLLGGLFVPPARGALARFLRSVGIVTEEVQPVQEQSLPRAVELPPPLPTGAVPRVTEAQPMLPPLQAAEEPVPAVPVGETRLPELLDPDGSERLIERYYPRELQSAGMGGTVVLLMWVDSTGAVVEASVAESSGFERLDRAALAAAPLLRFAPALRLDVPVSTWVEFPVVFEVPTALPPPGGVVEPLSPDLLERPSIGDPRARLQWDMDVDPPPLPYPQDAMDLLARALDPEQGQPWASLDELLTGTPPAHLLSQLWRSASEALEAAIERDPRNPAPYLALAQVRRSQGLKDEALGLFERGIERAGEYTGTVPPSVLADLHFGRGAQLAERWLPWRSLGRVPSSALAAWPCAEAAGLASGAYADASVLVSWNYLCAGEFDRLMRTHFESLESLGDAERSEMLESFRQALVADAGHRGANRQFVLALADEGRWEEAFEIARRFEATPEGQVEGVLLTGLALHRLGRSQEAMERFRVALDRLPDPLAQRMRDFASLRPVGAFGERLAGESEEGLGGEDERDRFWGPLDPLLLTPVNEREVEHLARCTYALLRFRSLSSGAAQTWIRYGRPLQIRAIGNEGGIRTVFWDYGPGPDLTLRRLADQFHLDLTAEASAYLRELQDILPHSSRGSDDDLLPLSATVEPVRAADLSRLRVAVGLQVPPELAGAATDTLDLGVFFLSRRGERWSVTRLRISAEPSPVRVHASVPDGADQVVLELRDPLSGRAAVMRSPLRPGPPNPGRR
jgi:protein TonB